MTNLVNLPFTLPCQKSLCQKFGKDGFIIENSELLLKSSFMSCFENILISKYQEALGSTGKHLEALGSIRKHWVVLRSTRKHWEALESTGKHLKALGSTRKH
jgi:hypothetical protein